MRADKSKVIVLGGDERSVSDVIVDGRQLEYVSEFKYIVFVFHESRIGKLRARSICREC